MQRAWHVCDILFTHLNFRSKFEASAHILQYCQLKVGGRSCPCLRSVQGLSRKDQFFFFTQGWGRAYSSSPDEQGEGGLKGEASEKDVLPAIYIPLRQLKPLSFKPAPVLGDLMPILLHLPDI